MSDRVTVKRTVSLGDYEHVAIEVSQEVPQADGRAVGQLVIRVESWAAKAKALIKSREDLEELSVRIEVSKRRLQNMKEGEYPSPEEFRRIRGEMQEGLFALQQEWNAQGVTLQYLSRGDWGEQ